MKPAVVFSIPATTSRAYSWKWRACDATGASKAHFPYYYDCLADATANGYAVERIATYGITSPGWKALTGRSAGFSGFRLP
jgi:hypothetical protein